jgi:hypothetical protein
MLEKDGRVAVGGALEGQSIGVKKKPSSWPTFERVGVDCLNYLQELGRSS